MSTNYNDHSTPIEKHCALCGKHFITLTFDPATNVWSGTAKRHIKDETSVYICRDCDEQDITEAVRSKAESKSSAPKAPNLISPAEFKHRMRQERAMEEAQRAGS